MLLAGLLRLAATPVEAVPDGIRDPDKDRSTSVLLAKSGTDPAITPIKEWSGNVGAPEDAFNTVIFSVFSVAANQPFSLVSAEPRSGSMVLDRSGPDPVARGNSVRPGSHSGTIWPPWLLLLGLCLVGLGYVARKRLDIVIKQ